MMYGYYILTKLTEVLRLYLLPDAECLADWLPEFSIFILWFYYP